MKLRVIYLVVLGCALAVTAQAQFANVVQNPGFEQVGADGVSSHWRANMNFYTVVTEPVRSGSHALQWANEDPERYVLCSQEISLEPGRPYEFSVWVKTEELTGEETGATLCLEWWGADGEYLGGSHPAGVTGSSDWQQVRGISEPVPDGAVRMNVMVYVRRGMTGKAWFDDVVVRRWRGPLLQTMLLEPNYRGQITPGTETIELAAEINLADWDLEPEELVLRTQILCQEEGVVVQDAQAMPRGAHTRFSVPVEQLAPGRYEVQVTVARRVTGQELGDDSWRLHVLTPREAAARRSYIDQHNRLIRDGEPFFPLGMYWSGINETDLKVYADSEFNCLMPYGMPSKEQMDLAHNHALAVIYSVKDIYYGSTWCPPGIETLQDERAFIEDKVTAFRDHPALLAWYLNDELPLDYLDRLEAHQEWLEELDPGHPTWVVLYQVGELEQYRKTFDVIGTDPYPIPQRPVGLAAQWTRRTVDAFGGRRPVWMVPQAFNWANYRRGEAKEGLRPPTYPELRSMAWQCIAHGAQGLIFYSFYDLQRDEVVPFDEQWGYVKDIAAEIKAWVPAILSVEPAPCFDAPDHSWLHWTTRQLGGTTILIAVSDSDTPKSAHFQLPEMPATVRSWGTDPEVSLHTGFRLPVEFEPFGVQVFEVNF